MSDMTSIETIQALKVPVIFQRLRLVPFWCSVIVCLISVSVLIGWSLEIDFLKRIIPGYVFMNPTTAITFILSGIALWLLQSADVRRIRVAQVCAAVAAFVGLIKLCAVIGFFDIGIDRVFFVNQSFDNVTGQLNRMAPNTALNFLLFGAALLLFNRKSKCGEFCPAQYPAIFALLSSFVAIISYLYGAESFYIIASFNPMAIHAAVSFLLLTVGLLLAKPEHGIVKELLSRDMGGDMARRLFPLVVFVPVMLGWLELIGERKGFYKIEIGNAMLVVAIVVILGTIILNNARLMNIAAAERKQTEEALDRSLSALNATHDGVFIFTADTLRFFYVNEGAIEQTGYSREELLRMTPLDIKPEFTEEEFRRMIAPMIAGESASNTFTTVHRHKDKRDIPVEIVLQIITSKTGEKLFVAMVRDITERKRVEDSLRETTMLQRAILNGTNYMVMPTDLDGTIRGFNAAAESLLGYTAEEIIGKVTPTLFHDADEIAAYTRELTEKQGCPIEPGREFETFVAQTLTGIPFEREWTLHRKDGTSFPSLLSITALRNDDGKVTGYLGIGSDITERKRAEDALRLSEERNRGLIENAKDMIYTMDLSGRFTSLNQAGERITGYTEAEARQSEFADVMSSEDAVRMRQRFEKHISGEEMPDFELEFFTKDGGTLILDISSRLIIKDGAPFAIQGIGRDITERKRSQDELQKSRERYELAVEGSNDGLWDWYIKTNEIYFSPRWKSMLGYEEHEVESNFDFWEAALHPDDHERSLAMIKAFFDGGIPQYSLEHRLRHKDGSYRWILARGALRRDKSGKPSRMSGSHTDITERKQLENDLIQARDTALESVRLKSEFLANMSHEIRTPMNGVIGMTGLLLDTNLSEEQRDYASTVQTSADALLRIIDDILDFSKIEAGQLSFEKIYFDLRECVESPIELLAERAQSKGIELASLVYQDVPTQLCGDPGRLRQILTNLIGNAVKFTEKGEVTVNVRKQNDSGKYVTLRFEVTDTGIGISDEAQSRLFRAFTQADGSTTRKYGGTGLGLAISKQLAEMMDGEIGIESEPEMGSTFWFTARFEKQVREISPIQPVGNVSLEGVRVLIVDDNATNRKIFLHQTNSWGMIAAEADSGAQALEMLRSAASRGEPFEIAILDLMMPEMDGFELARTIKSEPLLAGTHLVLLPSYGKRGDGQTARDFGIAAYIQKPVRQSQLFNCLITIISEASGNHSEKSLRLITQHSLRRLPISDSESKAAVSKARILIAEDNPVNRKVALSQLKSLGYAADVAKDGLEAINAVKKQKYDVILMDCQMPEMDGFEATNEIRRFEGDSNHTTIVAMTAHALEGERERCLAAGMDDYISKPVKLETLKQTLDQWLAPVAAAQTDVQTEASNISTNGSKRPSVDWSVLNGFRDLQQPNEPDLVTELIDLYLEDGGKRIIALKKAVADQETAKIKEQAHGIKGSSSNIGALHIAGLSAKLEEKGLDTARMGILIAEIAEEFQEVARILSDMRQSDQSVV